MNKMKSENFNREPLQELKLNFKNAVFNIFKVGMWLDTIILSLLHAYLLGILRHYLSYCSVYSNWWENDLKLLEQKHKVLSCKFFSLLFL